MTDILVKGVNLVTDRHTKREDNVKGHGEKRAIYKPRVESWDRSFPHSSHLNLSTLLTPSFRLRVSRTVR